MDLARFVPAFLRRDVNGNGAKALTQMVHDGTQGAVFWNSNVMPLATTLLPNTRYDYAAAVGDGLGSSVLAPPLNWLMRNFIQAPPLVERRKAGQWQAVADHELTVKLATPNGFYNGVTLWMATVLDFAFGEAYWLKLRNRGGELVELWWVPRQLMEPVWPRDGTEYINHYLYKPKPNSTSGIKVDPKDVVHFRFGLDPRNPRRGYSQLNALFRDVFTDDEAANFAAAILKNLGIIGVIVSPKEKSGGTASKEATKEVKEYMMKHFAGDKRAEPLALGAPTDVNLLQYNLQGFDVSPLRDVSEERVCAALGIPAAVVGFGTGLQQTKVGATMKEMRRMAWTDGVIPLQTIIAAEVQRALLPEFDTRAGARVVFDLSKVPALWEDQNEKHDRVRKDMLASIITRNEARQETGREAADGHDVFLQPANEIALVTDGDVTAEPTVPSQLAE